MTVADMPKIAKLSTAEKILFVEDLWDSIADDKNISVPQAHKDELDRRRDKHCNSNHKLRTLSELQSNIEKRKK